MLPSIINLNELNFNVKSLKEANESAKFKITMAKAFSFSNINYFNTNENTSLDLLQYYHSLPQTLLKNQSELDPCSKLFLQKIGRNDVYKFMEINQNSTHIISTEDYFPISRRFQKKKPLTRNRLKSLFVTSVLKEEKMLEYEKKNSLDHRCTDNTAIFNNPNRVDQSNFEKFFILQFSIERCLKPSFRAKFLICIILFIYGINRVN